MQTVIKQAVWILFTVFFHVTLGYAQEDIEWASEVLDATSQASPLQYAAHQVLGRPNVYPKSGDNPNAWRAIHPNKKQYIVVKFDHPIHARQIVIVETENPGAVKKVTAYDESDKEHPLIDIVPSVVPSPNRVLNLFFDPTPYKVAYIRVDMEGGKVPGYNGIDAIGISSSKTPVAIMIATAKNVNENLKLEKLSKQVNSPYSEHGPLLSLNGKTLYFSRSNDPQNVGGARDAEDIWYTQWDENTKQWLPAQNMGKPLNTPGPNFICSIMESEAGEEVLLLANRYKNKGEMDFGLSMVHRQEDGTWSNPVGVKIQNNYNYSDKVDYFMSSDAEVLLMSAERHGTFGKRDLYASFSKGKNNWSKPKNLGRMINTSDTESAPFLAKDGKTLYFSSKGFGGYGLSDVYVSHRLDDTWTNWSMPKNLGKSINGTQNDRFLNIPNTGTLAYLAKGQKTQDGNDDLYQFKIDQLFITPTPPTPSQEKKKAENVFVILIGNVFNIKQSIPISGAEVSVVGLSDSALPNKIKTDNNAEFSFKLRGGESYEIEVRKRGYAPYHGNIDLKRTRANHVLQKKILMYPAANPSAIVLPSVWFGFDESEVKEDALPELKKVLQILEKKKVKKIEVAGYTDDIGTPAYNLKLSNARAASVAKFFVTQGMSPSGIKTKGYGEKNPIVPNGTSKHRQLNRRVELTIIE